MTLLCILLIFGTDTVFTATLPLYGAWLGVADPTLVGLALSLCAGVGYLLLPFISRRLDGHNRRPLMLFVGICMILSCILVKEAHRYGIAAFLMGSLGFGLARIIGVVCLLTVVAQLPGSRTINQGWNGSLQRFGSLLAMLISGLFLVRADWDGVFYMMATSLAIWWILADRSVVLANAGAVRRVLDRRDESRLTIHQRLRTLAANFAVLRQPRVLASAALNILILLTLMHGNSLFSMAFSSRFEPAAISSLVVTTILVRDGVSVVCGVFFPLSLRWLRSRGTLWSLAIFAVLPFPLIICLPSPVPGLYVGAIAHGAMVGWGIATTNLLAAGTDRVGAGSRIAGSLLPAGAVLIVTPLTFGAAVGINVYAAYALLLLMITASAWIMLRAIREGDLAL